MWTMIVISKPLWFRAHQKLYFEKEGADEKHSVVDCDNDRLLSTAVRGRRINGVWSSCLDTNCRGATVRAV